MKNTTNNFKYWIRAGVSFLGEKPITEMSNEEVEKAILKTGRLDGDSYTPDNITGINGHNINNNPESEQLFTLNSKKFSEEFLPKEVFIVQRECGNIPQTPMVYFDKDKAIKTFIKEVNVVTKAGATTYDEADKAIYGHSGDNWVRIFTTVPN